MLELKANTSLIGNITDDDGNVVISCTASVSNDFANSEPQININDYEKFLEDSDVYNEEVEQFKKAYEDVAKEYQNKEAEELEKKEFRKKLGADYSVDYYTAPAEQTFSIPTIDAF